METIQDGFTKGTSQLQMMTLIFLAATQMKMEAGNIANGKYKAKNTMRQQTIFTSWLI